MKFIEARFKHKAPQDVSEYKRIFNFPVSFGKSTNALLFDKKYLELPVVLPDKELLYVFENHAEDVLIKLSNNESITRKVSSFLVKMIHDKPPTLETVAKKFFMSVRKLQLLLENEGTTYKNILNTIRKELAFNYLRDNQISVAEVSYLLGFSEPSAFHRAFKKWTGKTPGNYRK